MKEITSASTTTGVVESIAGSRYVWLKNPANLTERQWEKFDALDIARSHLKTARAYQIRLVFQHFHAQPPEQAESYLKRWYFWATHSRLQPIIDVAKTIRRHQTGILRSQGTRLSIRPQSCRRHLPHRRKTESPQPTHLKQRRTLFSDHPR